MSNDAIQELRGNDAQLLKRIHELEQLIKTMYTRFDVLEDRVDQLTADQDVRGQNEDPNYIPSGWLSS